MEIVVKGRSVEVPDHFRQHVAEKLGLVSRLDPRLIRVDVELSHERNPRQHSSCQHIEVTATGKGPVVRAAACAETFYAALDAAVLKLEAGLRRRHDRKVVHHGAKTPPSVAFVAAASPADLVSVEDADGAVGNEHLFRYAAVV